MRLWMELTENPLFGVALSLGAYQVALLINRRLHSPLANPLVLSAIMVVAVLKLTGIPLEHYQKGGEFINLLLGPATAALAISVYRELETLKKNLLPILLGCLVGAGTSIFSVSLLCRLFGFDSKLTASLLPKSVTTPIAMEVAAAHGGEPAIAVAAVCITGVTGALSAPLLIRLFRVKNPVAQGVAIGSCSHALGTTKAVELGEVQGAMSGIAIGVSGLATVFLTLFL